ncbi:nucleotide exchange factor GrpE [Candidatus Thorarchaeota archaeon]|nr:MAG: nucleotide exchange factor GrpE [Candidatus Thorarchaeota archaeon]
MSKNKENNQNSEDISVDFEDEPEVIELTPENEIETRLESALKRSEDLFEKLRRLQADYDNYRKRMTERFEEVNRFASEGIVLRLLDVYDNLERAMHVDFSANPDSAKDGVKAIYKQLDKLLKKEEVRPIESIGKEFDPYYQHAVSSTHDPEKPDNQVIEELQKGYMIREKVLRPALVVVNRHKDCSQDDDTEESNSQGEDGE